MSPITLRLKTVRQKCGMTQKELADASGVRQATISLYERNPQRVDLSKLEQLARALGVSVRSLIVERRGDLIQPARLPKKNPRQS